MSEDPRVDVLYVAWNRKAFTAQTFRNLLENTDWGQVARLVVHDDGSDDGTAEMLSEAVKTAPVETEFTIDALRSPPAVMNRCVARPHAAKWFAKIDSDIMVPPGWLEAMLQVLDDNPTLDILGMEAGRMGVPGHVEGFEGRYWVEEASHVGGVGLFRTEAFASRPRMRENAGRDGLTHFQSEYRHALEIGWIVPDLLVCSLDQVPLEPWQSLAREYVEAGWARAWPPYHEKWTYYHAWWSGAPLP